MLAKRAAVAQKVAVALPKKVAAVPRKKADVALPKRAAFRRSK